MGPLSPTARRRLQRKSHQTLSQPRQRTLRRRHTEGGPRRAHQQIARHHDLRFRRRRLAGLFIANDTQPNKLYRNNRNGTFTEQAVSAGVAFSEDGVARGAMGTDAADYDRSGRMHLLVGNFSNQMIGLYHNEGNNLFVDEAPRSAIGRASLLTPFIRRFSSSITISTATPISSPATATSKKRSAASNPKFNTRNRRCCSTIWAKANSRM